MQLAHPTSSWAALALALLEVEGVAVRDREVVVVGVLTTLDVELVVLATFATPGLEPPPPQPATRTPLMKAATASRRAGDERASRLW
ncbi:MAG TPA: hypothetical protein VGK33_06870 [Chloroflexota bacterium]